MFRSLRHRPFVRSFNVLAVESSADDTCAAVVGCDRRIHSNIVIKQNEVYVCLLSFVEFYSLQAHPDTKFTEGYIPIVP
jgi:N6-L-threonylcarbamoyladenine synthase